MKSLLQPLQELAEIEEIRGRLPDNKGILEISGCMETQKVHLMVGLSGLFAYNLIIAEDEQKAREIYEDYRFYDSRVLFYPAKDLLFFQADIHGNLLIRQRMRVVRELLENEKVTVITSVDGCMDYLEPLSAIRKKRRILQNGEELDVTEFRKWLASSGYEMTGQVNMPGEFSVRGGIVDVYPLTEDNPIRIELWGDEIDSIRSFDAESQRSIENLQEIILFPAVEKQAEKGMVTFADYFPKEDTLIFLDEPNRLAERGEDVEDEYTQSRKRREEKGETTLPGVWMTGFSKLQKMLNSRNCVSVSALPPRQGKWKMSGRYSLQVRSVSSYNSSFPMLIHDLEKYKNQGFRTIVLSGSRTRANRLAKDLQDEGIPAFYGTDPDRVLMPGEIMVMYGHAKRGFEYPLIKFAVISETDIFGQEQKPRHKKKVYNGQRIRDFSELSVGDLVVHERHGLGIYRGIEKVTVDSIVKDYIKIEYKDTSYLYILATQLDALQKYSGGENAAAPRLNQLGGREWNKTRNRVKSAVKDIAEDLVKLYAARQNKEGYVYGPDTIWQKEFEEMFPYEETEDQLSAIEDTKRDMESTKIMDRLICGDVGYGKTEIALRAAFKAVQESRQVVYLVPTTILAQQHYNTFQQRMKDFPVRVDLLSRFRTPAQQKKTIEDLRKGQVDVVIGTHRALSKDVQFKNLGLLIIDEEQRFGVTHKEKIKQLKTDVDVLTLTATPIPRTLHMSLIGIRDMSVLEEPPLDRMPIQTYVMEYDEETVREAVVRELRRGGQVFYVYNRVNDISEVAFRLQKLIPEARVSFAHGQMSERELEQVMYRFISGEIEVLVTTTIIETGLDISNVNTMIIHDSDRYGLSQLYQLRGRIGRSNRTAYAFLMYRRDRMLRETAEKRLAAIREYTDLGSGFKISMRDLELRGAGNILGAQQHGHMNAVGYDLYVKMLSEAVQEAKGIETMSDFETTIDLTMDAYIPESYIQNEYQKLDLYKRIATIENEQDHDDILEEVLDRFGDPPKAVQNLLAIALLKAAAHRAYITEIRQVGREIRIGLYEEAKIDPGRIPPLIDKYRRKLTFSAGKQPFFFLQKQGDVLQELREFIRELI